MNNIINQKKPERLLLWKSVSHRVGFSKQHMYALLKKGQFPSPIKITEGGRLNAWRESDIDTFIEYRLNSTGEKS
jgi:predicted DNA-binding transcriptional regulator AlpA